jgi:hypothetical protein
MDQDSTKKVEPKGGILAFAKLMIPWLWIQQGDFKRKMVPRFWIQWGILNNNGLGFGHKPESSTCKQVRVQIYLPKTKINKSYLSNWIYGEHW